MEKEDDEKSEEYKALTPEQVWDFIDVASTFVRIALRRPGDGTAAKVKLYRNFIVAGSQELLYEDEPSEVEPEAPKSPGFPQQ